MWGWGWIDHLGRDLRDSARAVRKNAGFAGIVVTTVALGAGANTAIFSIVNGAVLKPLPFSEPNRLYILYEKTPSTQRGSVSFPNFLDWQRSTHAFSSLAAFRMDNLVLTSKGRPERLHAAMISAGFLSTLGADPILGREFSAEDDQLGAGGTVLISESFWRTRFAANANVLGKPLQLDGAAYTIVGVMPRAVQTLKIPLFSPGDVYVPVGQWRDPSLRDQKVTTGLCVVGRLASGVTEASARAKMSQIAANLAAAYPEANRDTGMNIVPLCGLIAAGFEPFVFVLANKLARMAWAVLAKNEPYRPPEIIPLQKIVTVLREKLNLSLGYRFITGTGPCVRCSVTKPQLPALYLAESPVLT